MNITPPFGYGPVVPMRRDTRVRDLKLLPSFATSVNVLPVTLSELPLASHEYPIMFVRIGQTEQFALVMVVGLEPTENVFAANGGWEAGAYVPAYVRRYPYCMTRIPAVGDQPAQLMICVEEAFAGDDGVQMFDEQGNGNARWNDIYKFLNEYEADLERTREATSIITDLKLLENTTLQANVGENSYPLQGLYRVNEQRLDQLNANEMKSLLRKGGLSIIYQHLSSITRFNRVVERKAGRFAAAEAERAKTSPSL
jgi:hypothetical protein